MPTASTRCMRVGRSEMNDRDEGLLKVLEHIIKEVKNNENISVKSSRVSVNDYLNVKQTNYHISITLQEDEVE